MFYLINKPIGISSFDVVRKLKKLLNTKKIGYLGTLDPLASGCLLIATENSTKLLPLLDKSEKTYLADFRIDGYTESLDLGTLVLPRDISCMLPRTEEELTEFILSQKTQIPPKYSALHIDGKRAYLLARDGEDFVLPERDIKVSNVEIIEFLPPYFRIRIRISSGGYIRSFGPVIAQFFGIPDAGYISALCREELHFPASTLSVSLAQDIDFFDPDNSLFYQKVFSDIPIIPIDLGVYGELLLGKTVPTMTHDFKNGQLCILNYKDIFYSLVTFSDNAFVIKRNNV